MLEIKSLKGIIQPNGEREVIKNVEHRCQRLTQLSQWFEENTIKMINDGWVYDYHVSRSANPGEVCSFKEWRKIDDNGVTTEIMYIVEGFGM